MMKSCGIYPPQVPGRILGKYTFSCNVQWCMQICHKPFFHRVRAIWKCSFTIFSIEIQIGNGCNVLNIAGNPIKDINVNLSFLSSWWKVVEYTPPRLENFFTSFLSLVSKVVEYTPPPRYLVEFWENQHFHVMSNDACKFAINLFPIMWGPSENVHLLYFLLQIQIGNGCNVLNIAGNPIKDINVNLSFLSSWWKVVEYTPPGLENFFTSFLSLVSKVVEYTPPPGTWRNFGKIYFFM